MLLTEPSVRDDHEPAPFVEHLTSAKLTDEFGSREGMSVHAMARTIAEDSLMPLLRRSVRATHILDDNELASDAMGFSDERGPSVRRQVVEEMAGEDPVELTVVERQRCDIPLEHTRMRHTGRSNLDHPSALVERHEFAAQMLGEEARAACDIEHPCRGQGPHYADELLDLRRPTGSLALRERPSAEPPVVVLGRTLVEMRTHLIVRLTLGHLGESMQANVGDPAERLTAHSSAA